MDMWYLGMYAQDTWRASTAVTVNAGVRWEPYFGQRVLRDHAPTQLQPRQLPQQRARARSSSTRRRVRSIPAIPAFPSGKTGLNTQWWNFSPRVGVAWDVTGDGRMAVRSSYGLGV